MNVLKRIRNKLKRNWREYNPFFWVPVSKKVILFESTSDFCDNSKALYDYMVNEKLFNKYKLIWMVEEPKMFREVGFENTYFYKYSDGGMKIRDIILYWYINARAKYCFYTHKPLGCYHKRNQLRVFLTHGTPLKDSRGKFWDVSYNSYIISTSDFAADLRCKAFLGGSEKVLKLGFPRNDKLFDKSKNNDIKKALHIEKFEKIILWMPTFKHQDIGNGRNDFGIDIDSDLSILTNDFCKKLNSKLKQVNIILIIKFHPHQNMDFIKIDDYPFIRKMTNRSLFEYNIDSYELLSIADALITDFSSVYLDFLLADKPIGFEIFDLDNYKNGIGFLVEDPVKYMPGLKIKNISDFNNFIDIVSSGKDPYALERNKMCRIFHDHMDGGSSERIVKYFGLL